MNKIKVLFAILLTVVTLTHSKPSQAVVSVATGGAATVGLYMIGGGVLGTAYVGSTCSEIGCIVGIIPLAFAAIGLLVLEGEQEMEFQSINAQSAAKIGLTEEERLSFNEELDQANMLLEEVDAKMSQLKYASPQDSVNAWNSVKDLVSPATFSAMIKIASQK